MHGLCRSFRLGPNPRPGGARVRTLRRETPIENGLRSRRLSGRQTYELLRSRCRLTEAGRLTAFQWGSRAASGSDGRAPPHQVPGLGTLKTLGRFLLGGPRAESSTR
jgi:hypothetical protein